ncbi:MAG: hypothetical protein B5766_12755 [Candidatus Lumbricidophila eiseniae]|uniref:Leucine rich repeat variant n=1 Tax=Candidatus Lumbricidiphila eiseniae TaxID=1969409 RepID=A0A2A6FMR9_9MICO|nr:MAG: hypothetical protein B5766_12755 [Candidatus Lumbricidophila eiseniae]
MTLTGHLDDPGSPVRAYLDGISPPLSAVRGGSAGAHAVADALGLVEIVDSPLVVGPFESVDAVRVGTAVDIRARVAMDGFDVRSSSAAHGVALLPMLAQDVDNGVHRAKILKEAFDAAVALLDGPSSETDLDRAAFLLAPCEQVFRGGRAALRGSVGDACDQSVDGQMFAEELDPLALADIRSLMEVNSEQIEFWRESIASGERFEPNPSFSGSTLVGDADGDWFVGETLIDCKVYRSLTIPKLRDFLRQLLGYVMLDLDDALGIRRVGVWLPRQRLTPTWSLTRLLGGDPEELLPSLREGFVRAARGQQLSVPTPISERHKHQVLADNRHTPYEMLSDLARSDDKDIRHRVGRNAVTPEVTVRTLAGDPYARVREGVAMNERAPGDVLEALAQDSSIKVRRAVAANPGAPQSLPKALTSDLDRDLQQAACVNDHVMLAGDSDALESAARAVVAENRVQISQDRDESVLDTGRFLCLLHVVQNGGWSSFRLLIPEASHSTWSSRSQQRLDVPEWLSSGLPDEVKADLMRTGRPAQIRQFVASLLPMSDPAVRHVLLNDPDPEIRWSSLKCSTGHPDDSIGELLGELAASEPARLRFRTTGNDGSSWVTPSEYNKQTLQLVATHPSTPYEALRSLMASKSSDLLVYLIENPSLDANDRDSLVSRMQSSKSVATREELAASSAIPAAVSEEMALDQNVEVRTALAKNQAASAQAFSLLSEDSDRSVRLAVLENPSTPADLASSLATSLLMETGDSLLYEVLQASDKRDDLQLPRGRIQAALDRLSKSRVRDPDLRVIAAMDKRAGSDTLTRLSKSADGCVRRAVAQNAHTPAAVLGILANDADSGVRAAVAGNSESEVSVLAMLARSEEWLVRKQAAKNPKLSEGALSKLLRDDNPHVRYAASENPSISPELARQAEAALADAPRLTHDDLVEMAASTRAEERERVALDPESTPDILRLLGGERRSVRVRRAVAANPKAPPEVLRSLADDKDDKIRHAVAFNGATPASLLADLAGRSIDLAFLVMINPDAPIEILDALAEDSEPLIRFIANGARSKR